MAKPAKPAAATKEEAPGEAAPKNNKLLIIIIAVLVLVIAGGAAAFFLMGPKSDHAEEVKVEPPKDPKFVPLEAFTVNLQKDESSQSPFLQITMSLKILEPELEVKIKAMLPEIRGKFTLLLSAKKPSEILSAAGMRALAIELRKEANKVLGIGAHGNGHGDGHDEVPAEDGHEKPADGAAHGEGDATPAEGDAHAKGDAAAEGDAPAEGEEQTAHATDAPAEGHEKPAANASAVDPKGVVEVVFTSFIIQ